MDVTPLIPADRRIIERYGADGFRVSGVEYLGPVIVLPTAVVAWAPKDPPDFTVADFDIVASLGTIEILLVGCGLRMALLSSTIRTRLREMGIGADAMDTGAACRTYNVLMAEGRQVAAALVPLAGGPLQA